MGPLKWPPVTRAWKFLERGMRCENEIDSFKSASFWLLLKRFGYEFPKLLRLIGRPAMLSGMVETESQVVEDCRSVGVIEWNGCISCYCFNPMFDCRIQVLYIPKLFNRRWYESLRLRKISGRYMLMSRTEAAVLSCCTIQNDAAKNSYSAVDSRSVGNFKRTCSSNCS